MYTYLSKSLPAWTMRLGLAIMLLSLALLTWTSTPAAAAGVEVQVSAQGSELAFHATTSGAPVSWDIWINTTTIQTSPYPPHFPSSTGTLLPRTKRASSSGAQTSFAPVFRELSPKMTYNYIVRAGSTYVTGQATTLKRQVSVRFDQIKVIDDSDDFSAGDLNFRFFVDGTECFSFGATASSGEILSPNKTLVYFPTASTLKVKVVGIDDDCDIGLCVSGLPSSGGGAHPDYDWATAESRNINIAQLGPTNANFVSKTIAFETLGYPLEFKVYIRIDVQYS
jgi:hypothetical protein